MSPTVALVVKPQDMAGLLEEEGRMDEALDAIMALLRCEEPVTMKTDWFELRDARLHLAPYTDPHFPIAVASVMTPAGMISAGKHGLGVLSLVAISCPPLVSAVRRRQTRRGG